jgi:hypothetical protein
VGQGRCPGTIQKTARPIGTAYWQVFSLGS